MSDPNETADLVAGITRACREHAAAAAAEPQDDEDDEDEVLEDDPDCE